MKFDFNKIGKVTELSYNTAIGMVTKDFPTEIGDSKMTSNNARDIDQENLINCQYTIFKFYELGNSSTYACVGTANYKDGTSEDFMYTMWDSDFQKIANKNLTYGEGREFGDINFSEKMDLINNIVNGVGVGDFGSIDSLIETDMKYGLSYEEVLSKIDNQEAFRYASYRLVGLDSNNESLLDVAKRVNPELAEYLEKEGCLTTNETIRYNQIVEGFRSGESFHDNYQFESDKFVYGKEDIISCKFDNFFKAGSTDFYVSGIKEFADGRIEEFSELVDVDNARRFLAQQDKDSLTVENITFGEKLKILVDNSLDNTHLLVPSLGSEEFDVRRGDECFKSSWQDLIDNGSVDIIMKLDRTNEGKANLLSYEDKNGETALDVVLRNGDLSLANDFMNVGARTSEMDNINDQLYEMGRLVRIGDKTEEEVADKIEDLNKQMKNEVEKIKDELELE